jgi:hypothetical protein
MTDIFATLKTVLETTGRPAYYEKLPVIGVDEPSYIRFKRISDYEFPNMVGASGLHRDRFDITVVGRTHADLLTLKALVIAAIDFNMADFELAYPLEGSREKNDGAETYTKSYWIFYKP